jgi:hypothetical protein
MAGMQASVSVSDITDVLKRFEGLRVGVQKKYLRASVNKVAKPYIPEVKALVAKGPTGNLKRSVGVLTESKVRGKTQTAILGFRRGDKAGENGKASGYHAWWLENGVKVRRPKNASRLRVPMSLAKQYPYLMGKVALIGAEDGGAAYFPEVAAVPGTGKFGQWADRTLPRIRDELIQELGRAVVKAEAENARRDAKGM